MSKREPVCGDEYTIEEYDAILKARGQCGVYVPSPHEAAAARGVRVPCRKPLPCALHAEQLPQ
jgi:hypothetical protein